MLILVLKIMVVCAKNVSSLKQKAAKIHSVSETEMAKDTQRGRI